MIVKIFYFLIAIYFLTAATYKASKGDYLAGVYHLLFLSAMLLYSIATSFMRWG